MTKTRTIRVYRAPVQARRLLAAIKRQEGATVQATPAPVRVVRCECCGDVVPADRSCDCWDYSTVGGAR